jgi:hypothetical protein
MAPEDRFDSLGAKGKQCPIAMGLESRCASMHIHRVLMI